MIQHIYRSQNTAGSFIQNMIVCIGYKVKTGIFHSCGKFIGEIQVKFLAVVKVAGCITDFGAGHGTFEHTDRIIRRCYVRLRVFKYFRKIVRFTIVGPFYLVFEQDQISGKCDPECRVIFFLLLAGHDRIQDIFFGVFAFVFFELFEWFLT